MAKIDGILLNGKDYLRESEAAEYCCVSHSQFKAQYSHYGLTPIYFMGRKVFRRTDLQRAIEREAAAALALVS